MKKVHVKSRMFLFLLCCVGLAATCFLMTANFAAFSVQAQTDPSPILSQMSESECIEFVTDNGIDIPDEFIGSPNLGNFIREIVLAVEANPDHMFVFNYDITLNFVKNIKTLVNDYYGKNNNRSFLSFETSTSDEYELQDSTLMYMWSNHNERFNCYIYSIERADVYKNPGYYSGQSFSMNLSIFQMATLVQDDLNALGFCDVNVTSFQPNIQSGQKLICIRKGSKDYHFMKYSTSGWSHKTGGMSILKYNYSPTYDRIWTNEYSYHNVEYQGTNTYTSEIYYIAYKNNTGKEWKVGTYSKGAGDPSDYLHYFMVQTDIPYNYSIDTSYYSGYTLDYWEIRNWLNNTIATGTSSTVQLNNYPPPSGSDQQRLIVYYKEAASCIAEGSLITLANGSQKPVECLTGDEILLVWNLYTGTFDVAPILFIDNDPVGNYEVINLYFSDGTNVKVIYEHAFWNFNLNRYVFLRSDAVQYINHWFNKQTFDEYDNMVWNKVQLVDVIVQTEYTSAWSPVTFGHLCYYVNGMLSMPGATTGLINIFEVDCDIIQYVQVAFLADIAEYGLFTFEEFAEIFPIPEVIFEAFSGQYLKISIGKGLIDYEELATLIELYANFFSEESD